MTPDKNSARDRIDSLLAGSYAALVDDLATTLDLAAGTAEATQPNRLSRLTADLHTTLDIDAGLSAIIGTAATSDSQPSSPPPSFVERQTEPANSSWVSQLARLLTALDAPARLGLRTNAYYAQFRNSINLALQVLQRASGVDHDAPDLAYDRRNLAIDLARNLARNLAIDLARGLTRAGVRARDLDPALASDLALAGFRAPDLDAVLNPDLDRDPARARVRARVRANDLDLDLDRALARDLTRAIDLGRALDLAYGLDRALDLARVRARDLDLDLDLARDLARSRANALAQELNLGPLVPQHDLVSDELRRLQDVLDRVVRNFVGANLRSASLPPLGSMERVRWSETTQWPPGREEEIWAVSVEIRPGLFEITGGTPHHDAPKDEIKL